MVWNLLHPAQYVTGNWPGGTTTQLAIYPETAVYANRDFLWRISSARVESESSVFTALPDYNRLLTVLDGNLDLSIDGGERTPLPLMKVRAFSGADRVESWGVCTDFNLMFRKGSCQGEMHAVCFDGGEDMTVTPTLPATRTFPEAFLALYCVKGRFRALSPGVDVSAGELLLCQNPEPLRLTGEAGTSAMAISIRSWQ